MWQSYEHFYPVQSVESDDLVRVTQFSCSLYNGDLSVRRNANTLKKMNDIARELQLFKGLLELTAENEKKKTAEDTTTAKEEEKEGHRLLCVSSLM